MALVTTFATTPLTRALYPPWYQRKLEAWKRGEIDWDSGAPVLDESGNQDDDGLAQQKMESSRIRSLLIYLRLDNMPTLLAFVSLLGGRSNESQEKLHPARQSDAKSEKFAEGAVGRRRKPVEVHGLRLIKLTERGSAVMRVAEVDEYSAFDPVLNTFRVLGQLHNLAVSVSCFLKSSDGLSLSPHRSSSSRQ